MPAFGISLVGNDLMNCAFVVYFMNANKYLVVSLACLKNSVKYRPMLSHFIEFRQSHGLVLLIQWSEDSHCDLLPLLPVCVIQ